jgi:hypothetical protein
MTWPKKQNGWPVKTAKSRQSNRQKSARAKAFKPIGPTELEAELEKIRDVAPLPRDDRLNKFLKRVYRLGLKALKSRALRIAIVSKVHLHPRAPENYAGYIIQAAAPHINPKDRYKYLTALTYAYEKNVKPNDLKEFLKKIGGLNKCCELWKKEYGN